MDLSFLAILPKGHVGISIHKEQYMAVGPTEVLSSGILRADPRNISIAGRSVQMIMNLMRAAVTATVNPSGAIVKNHVANIRDTGVGIQIDFNA